MLPHTHTVHLPLDGIRLLQWRCRRHLLGSRNSGLSRTMSILNFETISSYQSSQNLALPSKLPSFLQESLEVQRATAVNVLYVLCRNPAVDIVCPQTPVLQHKYLLAWSARTHTHRAAYSQPRWLHGVVHQAQNLSSDIDRHILAIYACAKIKHAQVRKVSGGWGREGWEKNPTFLGKCTCHMYARTSEAQNSVARCGCLKVS